MSRDQRLEVVKVKLTCESSSKENLKFYAKDDYTIEQVIPLIEVILRATPHSKLLVSPYEIVHGRPMPLCVPCVAPSAAPADSQSADPVSYYRWLAVKLHRLHGAVKNCREEVKIDDKKRYDRAHKVADPQWNIGDYVLLKDDTVQRGSAQVITKQHFVGPCVVRNLVHGRKGIGVAYQLVDENTGKALRNLVMSDRLKKFEVDRREFNERLPKIEIGARSDNRPLQPTVQRPQEPKPIKIMSKSRVRGKPQYRVKYSDQKYLCDWVNQALLEHYKRKMATQVQAKSSNNRRRKNNRRR